MRLKEREGGVFDLELKLDVVSVAGACLYSWIEAHFKSCYCECKDSAASFVTTLILIFIQRTTPN